MRPASILVAASIALSAAAWAWPGRADVSGHARVIDGDTLEVDLTRIRLFGVNVPDHGQSCTLFKAGRAKLLQPSLIWARMRRRGAVVLLPLRQSRARSFAVAATARAG